MAIIKTDLTNLNATDLTHGTVSDARLPATALNSNVDLTNLSASNLTSGTLPDARFPSVLPAVSGANLTNLPGGATPYGLFSKIDPTVVAWSKTGAFTMQTNTGLYIEVNGAVKTIASATSITMPSATAGTDYAIWCTTAGALEATANHISPPSANARKVGGFHYAPGGNATGTSGGNSTPAINEYSLWDLKWRPSCPDPRGMTLVAENFWSDIYLTGINHNVNGSSKLNVQISDGGSGQGAVIPTFYGGNGSTTYADYNWFAASEVLASHGKRHPTYAEFLALAYGSTENTSRGSDPVNTQLDASFTSRWGVIQATGCMGTFGNNFGGGADGGSYWSGTGITNGRGQTWLLSRVAYFGGAFNNSANSGTRFSNWASGPDTDHSTRTSRGICDHLTSV